MEWWPALALLTFYRCFHCNISVMETLILRFGKSGLGQGIMGFRSIEVLDYQTRIHGVKYVSIEIAGHVTPYAIKSVPITTQGREISSVRGDRQAIRSHI